ncbi:MAG: family 16 glycosylhydrolase [Janthinobacterium lividum]
MNKFLFLLLPLGSLLPAAHAQHQPNLAAYTLVAADEFNYTSVGQLVAGGMWRALPEVPAATYYGYSKTLTPEYELATDNISVQNGILRLGAKRLAPGDSTASGKVYTGSALLMALDIEPQAGPCDWHPQDWAHGFQFGAVEIRCKLPNTPQTWPAVWVLSPDTEIDLIDNASPTPHTRLNSGVLDWRKRNNYYYGADPDNPPPDPGLDYNTCGGQALSSRDLSQDFTVYTIIWTPEYVTFFVNGEEKYSVPNEVVRTDYISVESHPASHCLDQNANHTHKPSYRCTATLRLDMGALAGLAAEDYLYVDYVKIYKPKPGRKAAGRRATTR